MTKLVKVVAIFPELVWPELEQNLLHQQVRGLSLSKVRGLGDYVDYSAKDLLSDHLRLEIYTTAQNGKKLAKFIASYLQQHDPAGGLVAIEPVTEVFNVRLDG